MRNGFFWDKVETVRKRVFIPKDKSSNKHQEDENECENKEVADLNDTGGRSQCLLQKVVEILGVVDTSTNRDKHILKNPDNDSNGDCEEDFKRVLAEKSGEG